MTWTGGLGTWSTPSICNIRAVLKRKLYKLGPASCRIPPSIKVSFRISLTLSDRSL